MIYQLVRDWFNNSVIAGLNAGIEEPYKLREVDTTLDKDMAPANLKDRSYMIKFGDIEPTDAEADVYSVRVTVQFQFLIAKRNIDNYQDAVDTYLFPLMKILRTDSMAYENDTISESFILDLLNDIKMIGLDKPDNSGNYIVPEISFDIEFRD